jgi:hypothetical protein
MFRVIALICSISQGPEECTTNTARDLLVIGEEPNELACIRRGTIDAGKFAILVGPDEWVKTSCIKMKHD